MIQGGDNFLSLPVTSELYSWSAIFVRMKKNISLNLHWRVINSNLFKTIQLDWATSSVQFLLLSGEKLISESLDCYFDKPNHNSLSAICDRIKNDSSISLNSHWQLSNYNLFKTLHLDWVPSSVQFLLLSGE